MTQMIGKKLIAFIFLMLAFSLGCNAQETKDFYDYEGMFFRISGNGLTKPSYILGTMHSIPGDFVYTLPCFEEIIGSVEQLVTEYNFEEQWKDLPHRNPSAAEMDSLYRHIMSLYTDTEGRVHSFLDDLPKKKRQKVQEALSSYFGFTDPAQWTYEYVDRNLSVEVRKSLLKEVNSFGYDFHIGCLVDHYLIDSVATNYHLPVIGLDKKDAVKRYTKEKKHLESLWGEKTKRKAYADILTNKILLFRNYIIGAKAHSDYYLKGKLFWLYNTKSNPGEMKQRNSWWMQQIPVLIQEKSSFIEVGAAHLWDGRNYKGILGDLKKMGYTIERLK